MHLSQSIMLAGCLLRGLNGISQDREGAVCRLASLPGGQIQCRTEINANFQSFGVILPTMVRVNYIIQHNIEDEYVSDGDFGEFILNFHKLFVGNLIPPISVLNNVLLKREKEGGADNLVWKPFSISDADYNELVEKLLSDTSRDFRLLETPYSVESFLDWYIWAMEKAYGVPADRHRLLELKVRDCERRREKAIISNDHKDIINASHFECVNAGMELAEFLDRYLGNGKTG